MLVLGMGGGCDIFAAFAVTKHMETEVAARGGPATTLLYAACTGPRRDTDGWEPLASAGGSLLRATSPATELSPGGHYGTLNLERSCPRGPEGSPFLLFVPGRKGSVERVTRQNQDAMLPALAALQLDFIVAVDCGGDSLTGGKDFEGDPALGRDVQVLTCLRASNVPFVHIVLGPGCDAESPEAVMRASVEQLEKDGKFLGAFPLDPLLPTFEATAGMLADDRTPNLMRRAALRDLPVAEMAGGRDLVVISRHGTSEAVPRLWLVHGLAFQHHP